MSIWILAALSLALCFFCISYNMCPLPGLFHNWCWTQISSDLLTMNFSGQHGYISLSYVYSSFLFSQISGEADEWHLTLPSYTVDWLDMALYRRYTQLYAFQSQAFPEAKGVESVDFTFYTRRNCDQTLFKPSILFHNTILLLLNAGGKEFIEIKRINNLLSNN